MKRFFKIFFLSTGAVIVVFFLYITLIKKLDSDVLEMKAPATSAAGALQPILLPSQFINGERFYFKIPTKHGDTVLAFGDTGGGICMALPTMIDKLGMASQVSTGLINGIIPMKYILFGNVAQDGPVPAPAPPRYRVIRHPFAMVTAPYLFVPWMDEEMKFFIEFMGCDIFLGQNFFMGHAWTIDYPHRQIWVNTPLVAGSAGVQPIGFKKNSNHENVYGHASIYIEVNGEVIEVLFDTGATIVLSDTGKKEMNTTDKTIGGSFIAASIFDKWRKEHPEWKYYPKADMHNDVIEVPTVKIGGNEVGPVLFAKRPDENWSQGMIGTMDKVVKGAIGGSGLKYLKVTIDYNNSLIKFEK